MEKRVIWSFAASGVLRKVYLYLLKLYGDEYADRYLARVYAIADAISEHPTKGRAVDNKRFRRRWNINSHHYLLYEPTETGIKIVAMMSIKQGY